MVESIRLESHISDLYTLFRRLFPGDAVFWWKLALEESNRAALFRSGKKYYEPLGIFPNDLLAPVQEPQAADAKLDFLVRGYEDASPSRAEAFNIALDLEQSVGELHFQEFMDKEADSRIGRIFRQLNRDDKDHAKRISSYMESHGKAEIE